MAARSKDAILLASASPRRRMLLEAVGLELLIVAPAIDETPREGEEPVAYAVRLATEKARSVASGRRTSAVVAADTVVALDGAILAKAADEREARSMLARLAGRTHAVHTAVAVIAGGRLLLDVVSTLVRFRALGEDEIARYVATGEPMDKAGAYGIQGAGGALVAEVNGSYTNVVGLPLEETLRLLELVGAIDG
jgi:nucleoside triphosphate pyrophosphatase